ncbi:MAG: hypothetical protein KAH95_08515 [Spirochaetales bacterium]|nr:hypothetical protein [Spirochaetales bacterium]
MKKQLLLTVLLILAVLTSAFSLEGIALYEKALENYKQKQNEIALEQLLEFRTNNSESRKEDDALWYIGRLYERLDRVTDAELAFREVLEIQDSNRLAEAAYDLGQILYSRKDYLEITDLLSPLMELEQPDSYEIRSLEILGDSFYSLGRSKRSEYLDKMAVEFFILSAEVYEHLLSFQEDEKDRSDTFYSLGKSYRRLSTLGLDETYYYEYYEKALEALKKSELPRAAVLVLDLENSRKLNLELDAAVLGGLDNITTSFGADLSLDALLTFPLGFNKELSFGLNYGHDDFSFKTFNFDPLKTDDTRLIQSTDKISMDISFDAGSSRGFLYTLRLDGDYRLAEDSGDDYYGLKLSNDFLWRINSGWKTGMDTELGWKVFPDYLVGGHEIDSVQGDVNPFLQWYFSDNSDLTLTYGLNIKQYLEAKYDTSVIGVPSTKDRQYITNSIELDFNSKIGKIIDTSLSYELLYLESNNYDIWISSVYMADYYDYLQHKVKGSADFQWSDKFRTDFDGSFEMRNFTNYIAQDSAGVFLSGDEKRRDLTFSLDAEFGFVFWSSPSGAEAELIGQFWWDKSISNMEDEVYFDTNSDFFGGLLGVELRLP